MGDWVDGQLPAPAVDILGRKKLAMSRWRNRTNPSSPIYGAAFGDFTNLSLPLLVQGRPLSSDDPSGGKENRALALTRHRSMAGMVALAFLRMQPLDSSLMIPPEEFLRKEKRPRYHITRQRRVPAAAYLTVEARRTHEFGA